MRIKILICATLGYFVNSSLLKLPIMEMVQNWPQGTVATSRWFETQGISRQLRQKYLESGWIKALGYGAFVKLNDTPSWLGGYYALQQELELHVGGISSLEPSTLFANWHKSARIFL